MKVVIPFCLFSLVVFFNSCNPQKSNQDKVYTRVNFADSLFPWDGFGVNYVQSAQWRGYDSALNEDYGGFSQLNEQQKEEIMELIFGTEGLKPSLLKMFLDPYHEGFTKEGNDNHDPFLINMDGFDHKTTTTHMRYFAQRGLQMTRYQGRDLEIITTLYGPAPWMTKQKFVRGRDLDPNEKYELAEYMISWAKYLKEVEKLPVKYISLHNEGENSNRWDPEGLTQGIEGHDHNLWWTKEQIVDFLIFMPEMMQTHGLSDVGLTPGECVSWPEFIRQGIPQAITLHPKALKNMDLITSHSFSNRETGGVRIIRVADKHQNNRYLHTWTTSFSFIKMYIDFLYNIHHEIYDVQTNGLIMWSPIQTKDMWIGGEPNAGCAIWIDNGNYFIRPGYYFLKSFMRMGMADMNVVRTYSTDKDILVTAFGSGSSGSPDAFNILNVYEEKAMAVQMKIDGSLYNRYRAYRTTLNENYEFIGEFDFSNGIVNYTAPEKSSTTFIGIPN